MSCQKGYDANHHQENMLVRPPESQKKSIKVNQLVIIIASVQNIQSVESN